MTIQEAIDWLKAINATQKDSIHKSSLLQRKESIHMAIEALEKQIPKKQEISDQYHHYPCCPTCKSIFDADEEYYLKYGEWTYCGHCGQKIEWGE